MEPENWLSYSQELPICPYPEPRASNSHSQLFLPKISFNVILPSTTRSSE
jgi:hypothetical protein